MKRLSFPIEVSCWIAVGAFAFATLLYAMAIREALSEAFVCGNSVVDPLKPLLNIWPLIGLGGVFGLTWLSWKASIPLWKPVAALTLCVACTSGLLIFGIHFFEGLSPHRLSDLIWWLKPFS